jgi:hypothetical protein
MQLFYSIPLQLIICNTAWRYAKTRLTKTPCLFFLYLSFLNKCWSSVKTIRFDSLSLFLVKLFRWGFSYYSLLCIGNLLELRWRWRIWIRIRETIWDQRRIIYFGGYRGSWGRYASCVLIIEGSLLIF